MAALTKAYESYERPGIVVAYKAAASRIYKGALVGVNAAGYAEPMAHGAANLKFIGVANESVDNSSGQPGDRSINVTKTGSFVMKAAAGFAPTAASLGSEVHAVTDWEVQASASGLTNAYKVGTIVAIESTSTSASGVRVRIDRHSV